jgi:hypothetical protein
MRWRKQPPKRIRKILAYHEDVNGRLCPICSGTAKTPAGTWCVDCGATGIARCSSQPPNQGLSAHPVPASLVSASNLQ